MTAQVRDHMANEAIRTDERQDIGGLFSRMRHHILIITLCVAGFAALAFVATLFMPKTYTSAAQLDYSPQETAAGTNQQQSDLLREAQIDAQVQTVKSLPVAMKVVETLKLERDPILVAEAARFEDSNASPRQAIAAALLGGVDAGRVGNTTMFDVSYTDRDPLRAANMANAFAKAFLDTELSRKTGVSDETATRLEQRLAELRGDLEKADAAVASFRLNNNVLDAANSISAEQEIAAIRGQLASSRASAAEAAVRGDAASSSTMVGGTAVGPAVTAMGSLRQQRAEVARKVATIASRYRPEHPLYRDAQQELDAIDGQIAQEMASIARTARTESVAAGSNAASLSSSLGAAQERLQRNVRASVELANLERRAQDARAAYQQLLTSSVQQTADRALIRPDTRLAAPATIPLSPSSPNMPINVFMGMVLGLAIGIGIAYVRERWTQVIATVDDIEVLLGQNHLNSIPTPQSSIENPKSDDPVLAAVLHPLSAYTEAFRNLGTSLGFAARVKTGKVIGITSSLPKEGKTTTSIALARVLATGGAKVILIDADLRRRSVTMELAPTAQLGLAELLTDNTSLQQVILRDASGADILPIAEGTSPTPHIYETVEFEELMDHLRGLYDYIVVDTAPLLAVTDTRILLRHFDATALLTRWRSTPARAVRAAIHQVESVGGQISGIALTMVNLKSQAQASSGDPSYYTGYMKDYYTQA
jgi:polysaccharide biosynthesis transport protein